MKRRRSKSGANSEATERTVSLAVPGGILDNAQSHELRTYLAGQIARAACIFQVSEVIVYDEKAGTGSSDCNEQLAHILEYLECPQYLRKALFQYHIHLRFAGLLNPLDAPHHLRQDEMSPFREGVVLDKPARKGKGSFVDVGLRKDVIVDQLLQPSVRVTVQLGEQNVDADETLSPSGGPSSPKDPKKKKKHKRPKGKVVSPTAPVKELGIYWGYNVRLARSLSSVFSESPYPRGYDLTIGTSDKGANIDSLETLPQFEHCVIVFGGLQGLEAALECEETIKHNDPAELFHHYINTLPNQGSRTLRTEEAILISLSSLRPKLAAWMSTSS